MKQKKKKTKKNFKKLQTIVTTQTKIEVLQIQHVRKQLYSNNNSQCIWI